MIDIFSRYIVGWRVEPTETGELATEFIDDDHRRRTASPAGRARRPGHLDDLQARRAAARRPGRRPQPLPAPRVSNDNPYSEAAFKTLKYCPAFPDQFGSIADARAFCNAFFDYYNHEHRHTGIGLHTPASVHYGTADEIRADRAEILAAAYARNPERFRHRQPEPPKLPDRRLDQPTQPAGPIQNN